MQREQIKRVITEVMRDAASRQRVSDVPTVVDEAITYARGRREIVDVGCGSNPYVGYRLLAAGFSGAVRFVDWNIDALRVHEQVLRAIADADATPIPASWKWERATVQTLTLDGAVLLIQGTLPRRIDQEALLKPRDAHAIAAMFSALRNTRAFAAVIQLAPEFAPALRDGARLAKMSTREPAPVASAHWTPKRDPTDFTLVVTL